MSGNRLPEVFARATERPEAERDAFIIEACAGDNRLLADVRRLLAADVAIGRSDAWQRSALEHEAEAAAVEVESPAGRRVGPYELVAVIGRGGMGTVYRAARADAEYRQVVALKLLKRGMNAEQIVARFRAERQILARLEHPNIARLLGGGSDEEGLPYLVMECVDGEPLQAYCDARHLGVRERVDIVRQVCAAVHYAHQRMVIHRDLKPGNVLVTADGIPKLLDFGIAKLVAQEPSESSAPVTEAGMQMMTIRYASPEQVRGGIATSASDVYSLGVMLYELLTGRSPYRQVDGPPHELMRAVCEEEPARPSLAAPRLRGDLDVIVLKALRKDPAARYASADQLSEDLRRWLAGLPILARGDSFGYLAVKFVRRNKVVVGAAGLLLATLVTGIVMTVRAEARAERRFEQVRKLAHAVVFDYYDAISSLPGSTPVRRQLVHDALEYLDSLSAESNDASLQRELVDAYVRISDVQGNSYNANLGDTAGAIASARKAAAGADALLARDQSPESLRSAAMAYAADGSLLYGAGQLAEADTLLHRAVDLEERVVRDDPNNDGNALELAQHLRYLGDLYGGEGLQNLGRTAESVAYYQRAAAAGQAVVLRHPDDRAAQFEHYQTVLSLAGAQTALGHSEDAATTLREALGLIEHLSAADPNNTTDRMEVSNTNLRIGMQLLDARRSTDALPYIERSLSILEALSRTDPLNTLLKRDQSVVENHLADALRSEGRAPEALRHSERSLAIAEALSAADPMSAELRSDVAISHRKVAETLLALGRAAEAHTHAAAGAAILQAMAAGPSHDAGVNAQWGRALADDGDARAAQGDLGQAIGAYRPGRGNRQAAGPGGSCQRHAPIRWGSRRRRAGPMPRRARPLRRGPRGVPARPRCLGRPPRPSGAHRRRRLSRGRGRAGAGARQLPARPPLTRRFRGADTGPPRAGEGAPPGFALF